MINFNNTGIVRDGFTRPDDPSEEPEVEAADDNEDAIELYECPWCMKDGQTMEQIRACSGYMSTGMPPNETGHPYGCSCDDCFEEYRRLK